MKLKTVFLLLTILVAGIYVWPELNFQDLLSQGDHGRDLYAFDAVTHGQLPYKDFWWVYGPFMPYYYGLFFKIFGVHITSVLLGRALIVVLCAVFFYLAATCLMTPGLAFLGAIWFTQSRQEFFFTYNHIGGILAELMICWCLLSYLRNPSARYLSLALFVDFILGLIKINFGLAALVGIVLSVLCIDWIKNKNISGANGRRLHFGLGVGSVLLGLTAVYGWLLKDLPLYAIRQCMPYFGDDQPYHASPLQVIPYYLTQHWMTFIHSPLGIAIGVILHGATLLAVYVLLANKLERGERQNILLGLGVISLFFVLCFHEFLVSGVWYRQYWSVPFQNLFHFVMIAVAFSCLPKFLRYVVMSLLGVLAIIGIVAHIGVIQNQKQPFRYLSMERGHIYVGNEPQWTDTVNRVTAFLDANLKKDDRFFAMPYDCLYYYLTGTASPTRQLIFFDHIKIPQPQEISVINELESHHITFVLLSSRIISDETGLGVFGKTYCPLLARYVYGYFTPFIRQGGNWDQPPGWANNHGVLLLKRK